MHDATVIGLNQQACTGMLGSLRIAASLLNTEPETEKILCVMADRFPDGAVYEQAYNLISDGAAACMLSREPPGFELICTYGKTNGALTQASDDEIVGTFFNNTHQVIQTTLQKAGLTMADIHWIVPQNTNTNAWRILARLLGFEYKRVFLPSIAEVGHVISGDINLKHLEESGQLCSDDHILMLMA